MTGTQRKRTWRFRNPERSREAERRRAQARRDGYWDKSGYLLALQAWIDGRRVSAEISFPPPLPPCPCASSTSYQMYENTTARFKQRLFYRRYGPGAHRLSREDFRALSEAIFEAKRAEIEARFS
jgi:hypothetical protein